MSSIVIVGLISYFAMGPATPNSTTFTKNEMHQAI
jgi:hypothetical protein